MGWTTAPRRRPIELGRRVAVRVDRALAALDRAPYDVVGSALLPGRELRREVRIGVGPLLEDDDVFVLPLWWEDSEHPQLFPTFDGGLEVRADGAGTEIRLVGSYRPPLGPLGRFADGLVGHRVVTASLESFLTDVADRLADVAVEACRLPR